MEIKETPQLDVSKYVGKSAIIVKADVRKGKFGLFVMLTTGAVDTMQNGDPITASKMLGFCSDDNGNTHYIAKNSKLDNFMRSKSILGSTIPDKLVEGMELQAFLGTKVVCQKNEKDFLELC